MNFKALLLTLLVALPAHAHRSQVWLKFDVPSGQEIQSVEVKLPVYLETVEQQVQLEIETSRSNYKTNDDPVLRAKSAASLSSEELGLLKEDLKTLRRLKTIGVWNTALPLGISNSGEAAFQLNEARARTGQAQIAELNILSEKFAARLKPETRVWFQKLASELSVRVVTKDTAGQLLRYSARIDVPAYDWKNRDQFISKLHQSLDLQRSRRDDELKFRASLLRTDKPEPKDWSGPASSL